MEYIKGENLLTFFKKKGSYSEKDASMVILKILGIFDYCQSKNVIYRDIKLENLMIIISGADYILKLCDFGLATIYDPLSPPFISGGTPGYAAPELLGKKHYDFKVDIFSLGVILYFL